MTTPGRDHADNLAILENAARCWNAGDRAGYLDLYAEQAVLHGYPGVEPGLTGIRQFYSSFWNAFPTATLVIEEAFAFADRVVCRFLVGGTHLGDFQGIPPTGRAFRVPSITILRFDEGRCVERWSQADFLSLLQQLGALPLPAPARQEASRR